MSQQRQLQTPQAQQQREDGSWPGHLLSSASSIRTDDSFLSQIPLPYHWNGESQDARVSQVPARPGSSQSGPQGYMGYGQQRRAVNFAPISEEPEPEQQTPVQSFAPGGGRRMPNFQGPSGPGVGQYNQQDHYGRDQTSSYDPYGGSDHGYGNDGYEQSSSGHSSFSTQFPDGQQGFNQGPSHDFNRPPRGYNQDPPQGFNRGPPYGFGQNQYQSGFQNEGYQNQGYRYRNQGFQNHNRQMSAGFNQGGFQQNDRAPLSRWNPNRFNAGGGSNFDENPDMGGGPHQRQFRDPDFMANKGGLQRRRSAGTAQHYNNPRFNNYNSDGPGKRLSLGDDPFGRQAQEWTNYNTRGDEYSQDEENEDTFVESRTNTPKQSLAKPLPAPTPKTARELGQATPSHLERTVTKQHEQSVQLAKGPPPAFGLDSIAESPTKRSRRNTQNPFSATAVQSSKPQMTKSLSTNTFFSVGAPNKLIVGPSPHLAALCPNGQKPSTTVAFDGLNMPFVETARLHPSSLETGVVHVYNIPFSCSSQEILAFFGRSARTIPDVEEPVHVIMERVTSKTMDAFVEFVDIRAAISAVDHFELYRMNSNGGKIGQRQVVLEVCGHEVLMKALFPKAKSVKWRGTYPEIIKETDQWNTGFKGFVSHEELVMLVKHIEHPSRAPFSVDCPQRPYECLISTLTKYPWNCVDSITIGDRDALHTTTLAICKHMVFVMNTGQHELHIDQKLLRRVKRAVFGCHGFTEAQKDDFAFVFGHESIEAGLPPYAEHWYVFKTISAKRGWAPDVILYYIALLREATTSSEVFSLAERAAKGHQTKLASPFGNLKIDYPANVSSMTLAEVGALEWHAIEALLRKVLPSD